jgi:hypothetical protein
MKRSGQVTVEYLLLIVVIFALFMKVIGHVQDIFYGNPEDGITGSIQLILTNQVANKLSTDYGAWLGN